jgi:hypothetical protein
MSVRIPSPGRGDRNGRPRCVKQGIGRRRPAAVVGDLEKRDPGDAAGHQERIDLLLDVAGEQELLAAKRPEQDDRDVVDSRPRVRRLIGNAAAVRPKDPESGTVESEFVAGEEASGRSIPGPERRRPGCVTRSGSTHPWLGDAADSISGQEERQSGNVILVRVGQDDEVEPSVPRRQSLVERCQQPIRIGTAVDEHPTTTVALDEHGVPLSDIEDRDVEPAIGPMSNGEQHGGQRHHQRAGDDP